MSLSTDYLATEPTPQAVQQLPGVTLLEFGTSWCGHCRAAQAPLRQAMQSHPELRHLKIADGSGQPLGRAYGVKLWPTFVLLRDGQEVAREVRPRDVGPLQALLSRA